MATANRKPWRILASVVIFTTWLLVTGAVFMPVIWAPRESPTRTRCLSKMKQLALAVIMYETDFDDRLPPAPTWADLIKPYTKDDECHRCPGLENSGPDHYGHAYRRAVGLKLEKDIPSPADEPMLFDSVDTSWNANGDFRLVPPAGRHKNGDNTFGFVDGHCRYMTTARFFDFMRQREKPMGRGIGS